MKTKGQKKKQKLPEVLQGRSNQGVNFHFKKSKVRITVKGMQL